MAIIFQHSLPSEEVAIRLEYQRPPIMLQQPMLQQPMLQQPMLQQPMLQWHEAVQQLHERQLHEAVQQLHERQLHEAVQQLHERKLVLLPFVQLRLDRTGKSKHARLIRFPSKQTRRVRATSWWTEVPGPQSPRKFSSAEVFVRGGFRPRGLRTQ